MVLIESFLHAPWMLAGLAVLVLPPLIHLLNRRRHEVVDWGAMQFLQVSNATRRRMLFEELLLMLTRMALLALLVLALAGPFADLPWPSAPGVRPPRDIVLVIDGSASMGCLDEAGGPTPADRARTWAGKLLDELGPDDGIALVLARERPVSIIGQLSRDRARIRESLAELPAPSGSCHWPSALEQAVSLLGSSEKPLREIVLVGDGQRFGLADPDTLFRWELLVRELRLDRSGRDRPALWMVDVATRSDSPPNYTLTPLTCNRPVAVVDREVTFRAELVLVGQKQYLPPYRLRLEVNGKTARTLPPPGLRAGAPLPRDGRVPITFTHRFARPGSQRVSLVIEPDPPPGERQAGSSPRDFLPGDNRQDLSVEVLASLPVLLVDGETSSGANRSSRTDFLRDALAPARDPAPIVRLRVVSLDQFAPGLLAGEERPRVLILHDVPQLAPALLEAVTDFIATGGGVLLALGEHADASWYNQQVYRNGEGWMPARLEGQQGDEGRPSDAAWLDLPSFRHPALELLGKVIPGGLNEARFLRWWKLETPGKDPPGVPVGALLSGGQRYPFLVERAFQAGRVLACAVPLDSSQGSTLVDLAGFVPLAHELVYYLAGARATEFNLRPGQPLRRALPAGTQVEECRLSPPEAPTLPLSLRPGQPDTYLVREVSGGEGASLVYPDTFVPGGYRLEMAGKEYWYVVPHDPREADLTPCSAEQRQRLGKLLGLGFEKDLATMFGARQSSEVRLELWFFVLLGLLALLCVEVWMTRRLVQARQ